MDAVDSARPWISFSADEVDSAKPWIIFLYAKDASTRLWNVFVAKVDSIELWIFFCGLSRLTKVPNFFLLWMKSTQSKILNFFCWWSRLSRTPNFLLWPETPQKCLEFFLLMKSTQIDPEFFSVAEVDSERPWISFCGWNRLSKAMNYFSVAKDASTRSWIFFSVADVDSVRLWIFFLLILPDFFVLLKTPQKEIQEEDPVSFPWLKTPHQATKIFSVDEVDLARSWIFFCG